MSILLKNISREIKMKVICPNCSQEIKVNAGGRPKLGIPLKNILETLQNRKSIASAAEELGCSQGYIFNALKVAGLQAKDLIK
jgi:hypothetical protein